MQQKQVSYKVGEGIVGEVLRQGSSVVVRNLGSDLRFADKLALYDYRQAIHMRSPQRWK
ncbi:hypothetical protein P4S72_16825 [Vibrio sp. PP-XX7]